MKLPVSSFVFSISSFNYKPKYIFYVIHKRIGKKVTKNVKEFRGVFSAFLLLLLVKHLYCQKAYKYCFITFYVVCFFVRFWLRKLSRVGFVNVICLPKMFPSEIVEKFLDGENYLRGPRNIKGQKLMICDPLNSTQNS